MRKLQIFILMIGMALYMTGCSAFSGFTTNQETTQLSASDITEQQETAQAYMAAMQQGDLTGALSYCTEDFQDGFKVKDLHDSLNEIMQKYNLTGYSSQMDQIVQEATQKVFASYTLDSSNSEVTAAVNGIRVDKLEGKVKTLVKDYMADHASDVLDILTSGGDAQKIQELAPEVIKYISDHAQSELQSLKYENMTVRFAFKKENGAWKIAKTEIEDDTQQ